MANLLTPEQKKYNTKERLLRIVVVVLWFVFGAIIIVGVFLTPSYILVESKKEFNDNQVTLLNDLIERRQASDVQEEIRLTKVQLDLLSSTIDDVTFIDVLDSVISTLGPFITISGITYTSSSDGIVNMNLAGVASDRVELISFTKRLEREPMVQSVELPVSNFVQSSNISFSVRVEMLSNSNES